jgi:hypothetical protein
MESPLRGDTHGGFGERPGETDQQQCRHRAPGRLNRQHAPKVAALCCAVTGVTSRRGCSALTLEPVVKCHLLPPSTFIRLLAAERVSLNWVEPSETEDSSASSRSASRREGLTRGPPWRRGEGCVLDRQALCVVLVDRVVLVVADLRRRAFDDVPHRVD